MEPIRKCLACNGEGVLKGPRACTNCNGYGWVPLEHTPPPTPRAKAFVDEIAALGLPLPGRS